MGMLLEEFVLHLLKTSGYRTVLSEIGDPSLSRTGAGICVEGRGGKHQIDAIADYNIPHPFAHPSRLLVEAKAYSSRYGIGIEVIRNAVGVMHDVNEWWWKDDMATTYKRHIYNYAVFTLDRFSIASQMYAFAHGIFLVPLGRSGAFRPVIEPMRRAGASMQMNGRPGRRWLHELRMAVRGRFNNQRQTTGNTEIDIFCEFVINRYEGAVLANLGGKIPVFLLPTHGTLERVFATARQGSHVYVRVFWDDDGWYLDDIMGQRLFTFDLPDQIVSQYAQNGRLTQGEAINLKHQELSDFDAVLVWNGEVARVRFSLDGEWIDRLRRREGMM